MQTTELEQIASHLEAAFAEFAQTTEGTPEYYRALAIFICLLFPDGKPQERTPNPAVIARQDGRMTIERSLQQGPDIPEHFPAVTV